MGGHGEWGTCRSPGTTASLAGGGVETVHNFGDPFSAGIPRTVPGPDRSRPISPVPNPSGLCPRRFRNPPLPLLSSRVLAAASASADQRGAPRAGPVLWPTGPVTATGRTRIHLKSARSPHRRRSHHRRVPGRGIERPPMADQPPGPCHTQAASKAVFREGNIRTPAGSLENGAVEMLSRRTASLVGAAGHGQREQTGRSVAKANRPRSGRVAAKDAPTPVDGQRVSVKLDHRWIRPGRDLVQPPVPVPPTTDDPFT